MSTHDETVKEPASEDILTVDDVAALLGVGRDAILIAIRRKELPAKKFGNRYGYRIRRADYEAWLATPSPTNTKEAQA